MKVGLRSTQHRAGRYLYLFPSLLSKLENRNEEKPPKNACSGEMYLSVFLFVSLFVLKPVQFLSGLETFAVCLSRSPEAVALMGIVSSHFQDVLYYHKFRSTG